MRGVLERSRGVTSVPYEIVPLPDDRRHLAADFLARVCADHPLLPYLVPARSLRTRLALASAGLALLEFAAHAGEVDVTDGRLHAMAVWVTPGSAWSHPTRRLRAVRLAAAFGSGPDGFVRVLRAVHHLERALHRLVPRPHRDLVLLAAQPGHDEDEVARRLLRVGLARCGADGLTATSVCFRAATVLFLVAEGFRVVAEDDLPGGGPHYWIVVRNPDPSSGVGSETS